jgi:hypothetical protein
MKFRIALTTSLLALSTVGMVACDDDDEDPNGPPDTETFTATLNGASEVPPVTTTTATGTATFTATTTGNTTTIVYTVTVSGNLSGPVTAAHIHGPANATGTANPIVTLQVTSQNATGVVVSGSFTTTGNATINMAQLLAHMDAGNTYVNLHTTANPNGEIRGQISD